MKVLAVLLQHDYGDPEKGESYEHRYIYRTLAKMHDARLFDFGPYLGRPQEIHAALMDVATEYRPDVVFTVLYQDQVESRTIRELTNSCTTVNWFCDDQWRLNWSLERAKDYTAVVTTDRLALGKYKEAGVQAILSQWGADPRAGEGWNESERGYGPVSFVGMANSYRRWVVAHLASQGVEVECWGTGWPNGRLDFAGMNRLYWRSAVVLNLPNSRSFDGRYLGHEPGNLAEAQGCGKVRDQVKGRHFEVAAAGGFQLTNYVDFLEDYFVIGHEIACWESVDGLAEKVRYYKDRPDERLGVAEAGRERVLLEHTWEDRLGDVFRELEVTCYAA